MSLATLRATDGLIQKQCALQHWLATEGNTANPHQTWTHCNDNNMMPLIQQRGGTPTPQPQRSTQAPHCRAYSIHVSGRIKTQAEIHNIKLWYLRALKRWSSPKFKTDRMHTMNANELLSNYPLKRKRPGRDMGLLEQPKDSSNSDNPHLWFCFCPGFAEVLRPGRRPLGKRRGQRVSDWYDWKVVWLGQLFRKCILRAFIWNQRGQREMGLHSPPLLIMSL